MTIDREKLIEIRTVYEIGNQTKTDICLNFGINRDTLYRNAKRGQWGYGKTNKNHAEKVIRQTSEKIAAVDSDRAAELANDFFQDVVNQKGLIATVLEDFQDSLNSQDQKISKVDAMRLCEAMKFNKITMETLMIGFTGSMKALGLFKEEFEGTTKPKLADLIEAFPPENRPGIKRNLLELVHSQRNKGNVRSG